MGVTLVITIAIAIIDKGGNQNARAKKEAFRSQLKAAKALQQFRFSQKGEVFILHPQITLRSIIIEEAKLGAGTGDAIEDNPGIPRLRGKVVVFAAQVLICRLADYQLVICLVLHTITYLIQFPFQYKIKRLTTYR